MIYFNELVKVDMDKLPKDHQANLIQLHYRLNMIRRFWQKPMNVSSGYRTKEDHFRIYKNLGRDNPPMGSQHLIGAAADIWDGKGELKSWIADNLHVCEDYGLWLESFDATGGIDSGWIHFQLYPPKSGNRFFKP
jgi:hypothetical protein